MMMIVKMRIVLLLVIIHVLYVLYVLCVCVLNSSLSFCCVAENNTTKRRVLGSFPFKTEKIFTSKSKSPTKKNAPGAVKNFLGVHTHTHTAQNHVCFSFEQ